MELPRRIFNELEDITSVLESLSGEGVHSLGSSDSLDDVREAHMERYMIGLESFGKEVWRILERLQKTRELCDTDVSGMLERLENIPHAKDEVKRMGREAEFGRQYLKMRHVHRGIKSFSVSLRQNRPPHRLIESSRGFVENSPSTLMGAIQTEVDEHLLNRMPVEAHCVMQALKEYTQKLVCIDRAQADISNVRYALGVSVSDLTSCSAKVAQQWRSAVHTRRICDQLEGEMESFQQCSSFSQSDSIVAADVSCVLQTTRQRCLLMERVLAKLQQTRARLTRIIADHNVRIATQMKLEASLIAEGTQALARCHALQCFV